MRTPPTLAFVLSLALLAACTAGGGGGGGGVYTFKGQVPPEVPAGVSTLDGRGLSLASLRGQVVYVQFSFPQCPACRAVLPRVVGWDQQLRGQGFTALYVADGRRDSMQGVRTAMTAEGVGFPVLYDAQGAMTGSYHVSAFPTAYVLGRDGHVVWEGIPSSNPGAVEAAIRAALAAR